MIMDDGWFERCRTMSASKLTVRFSDFKWSDKVALRDFEAEAPEKFRKEIKDFVLGSKAQTETESYRLQMLGEFVAWMLDGERLDALKSEFEKMQLSTSDIGNAGWKQFVSGLEIGENTKRRDNVTGPQHLKPVLVHPE